MRSTTETSKFLSFVLRHKPEAIGITLDREGWVKVETLVDAARRHGRSLDAGMIERVVATNDKQRFALSADGKSIRANQGHSTTTVEIGFAEQAPPPVLYHGTVPRFVDAIRGQGLKRGSRHHVHLSPDRETATLVGRRRGDPVVLVIDAARMHAAGHAFFLSANGVWLTDHVPAQYIADWGEDGRV